MEFQVNLSDLVPSFVVFHKLTRTHTHIRNNNNNNNSNNNSNSDNNNNINNNNINNNNNNNCNNNNNPSRASGRTGQGGVIPVYLRIGFLVSATITFVGNILRLKPSFRIFII